MEQDRQHHGGNFSTGFLFGIIVGVVFTLLFSTKKGRAILRELTEEGKDKVADIREYLESVKEQADDLDLDAIDDDLGVSDYIEKEVIHADAYKEEDESQDLKPQEEKSHERKHVEPKHIEPVHPKKTTVRRFFKGVPKRG
jgi:gas vesicle protein